MKNDLMPLIIIIVILGIVYLFLRFVNKKNRDRLSRRKFHKRR